MIHIAMIVFQFNGSNSGDSSWEFDRNSKSLFWWGTSLHTLLRRGQVIFNLRNSFYTYSGGSKSEHLKPKAIWIPNLWKIRFGMVWLLNVQECMLALEFQYIPVVIGVCLSRTRPNRWRINNKFSVDSGGFSLCLPVCIIPIKIKLSTLLSSIPSYGRYFSQ